MCVFWKAVVLTVKASCVRGSSSEIFVKIMWWCWSHELWLQKGLYLSCSLLDLSGVKLKAVLVDVTPADSLCHTEVYLVFTGRQTPGSPATPQGLWVKWEELRQRPSPEPCGWRWAAWPRGPAAPGTSVGSGPSLEPWRWFHEELFQTLRRAWPPWRQNTQILN